MRYLLLLIPFLAGCSLFTGSSGEPLSARVNRVGNAMLTASQQISSIHSRLQAVEKEAAPPATMAGPGEPVKEPEKTTSGEIAGYGAAALLAARALAEMLAKKG